MPESIGMIPPMGSGTGEFHGFNSTGKPPEIWAKRVLHIKSSATRKKKFCRFIRNNVLVGSQG